MILLSILLVTVHAALVVLLPTVSAKAISALGLLVSFALTSALLPSSPVRRVLKRELPSTPSLWTLTPFVLPVLLAQRPVTIAFVVADGRFGVVAAWLCVLLWLTREPGLNRRERTDAATRVPDHYDTP